jgi:hypothetical protein
VAVHPELNGKRVKTEEDPTMYLVVDGVRRAFSSEEQYHRLWSSWDGHEVMDVSDIDEGPALDSGVYLAQEDGSTRLFVVNGGEKLFVPSEEVLNKFAFDTSLARLLPTADLDAISNGPDLG